MSICGNCPLYDEKCEGNEVGTEECYDRLFSQLPGKRSICCERVDCIFNSGHTCEAEHVTLKADGCGTFQSRCETNHKIMEARCWPFDIAQPIVFIQRSMAKSLRSDMEEMGFFLKIEPATGMFGKVPKPGPLVWVKRSSFDDLSNLLERFKERGFRIQHLISQQEISIFEGQKAKAAMSSEERESALRGLMPPAQPKVLSKGKRGATWNRKIYGRHNQRYIFLSGARLDVSADEVKELEAYLNALAAYEKKRVMLG